MKETLYISNLSESPRLCKECEYDPAQEDSDLCEDCEKEIIDMLREEREQDIEPTDTLVL